MRADGVRDALADLRTDAVGYGVSGEYDYSYKERMAQFYAPTKTIERILSCNLAHSGF